MYLEIAVLRAFDRLKPQTAKYSPKILTFKLLQYRESSILNQQLNQTNLETCQTPNNGYISTNDKTDINSANKYLQSCSGECFGVVRSWDIHDDTKATNNCDDTKIELVPNLLKSKQNGMLNFYSSGMGVMSKSLHSASFQFQCHLRARVTLWLLQWCSIVIMSLEKPVNQIKITMELNQNVKIAFSLCDSEEILFTICALFT